MNGSVDFRMPGAAPLGGAVEEMQPHDVLQRGIFGFSSRDRRSRAFNLLRSQILKIIAAKGWRLIGITSATPAVGKTFVACNIAASLSRLPDKQTLLFDLDLRRGSVAERYNLHGEAGIESYLHGEGDSLAPMARRIAGTNLTIYPSFRVQASSAELLAGARMTALIEAMRKLPDDYLCLCDLPPAFANDDSSIVLRQLDGYLLVVEEGKTTARQVRDAVEMLKPTPCLGTILNRYNGAIGSDDYGFGYWNKSSYDAYYS